jgi:undecaprenyl-diphosphatase
MEHRRARLNRLGFYFLVSILAAGFIRLSLWAVVSTYSPIDLQLSRLVQSVEFPIFPFVMFCISLPGNSWNGWILCGAIGTTLILKKHKRAGIVLLASVPAGQLLNHLLKEIIGRPRPTEALVKIVVEYPYLGFPSGHVVFYVQLFGFLIYLSRLMIQRPRVRLVSRAINWTILLLVGPSRIALGAHWPSDVLGGYLLGTVFLLLMICWYEKASVPGSNTD